MDSIQIHFLTAYPASCLVRGIDGRPKTMQWGGVERGRISSASLKRAVRTSEAFVDALQGNLGTRTARLGKMVAERLVAEGMPEDAAIKAASAVGGAFGKVDEGDLVAKQLAYISPDEVEASVALARRLATGKVDAKTVDKELAALLSPTTRAVDIALFGRMFAERGELRSTAACEVAHPFTVDRAALETDFYVAVDDKKPTEEDVGASFLGEQYFLAGLFYGYARIDMGQLERNLGGDRDLAVRAARSFLQGVLTVSPTGKKASFGSNARASWAMIERGPASPRSLAAAFLRPVKGNDRLGDDHDHLGEAVRRAEELATSMDRAFEDTWSRAILDVTANRGSLAEVLSLAGTTP